jgi:hypothetical protein
MNKFKWSMIDGELVLDLSGMEDEENRYALCKYFGFPRACLSDSSARLRRDAKAVRNLQFQKPY